MNMGPQEQRRTIENIRQSLMGQVAIKVLLVEDVGEDAQLSILLLQKYGMEVVWCTSVEEALEEIRKNRFRLVFLDLQLHGGRDGLEMICPVREAQPDCWVVVLTGAYSPDSEECKQALRLGASAIMLKPLTLEKIMLIFGRS